MCFPSVFVSPILTWSHTVLNFRKAKIQLKKTTKQATTKNNCGEREDGRGNNAFCRERGEGEPELVFMCTSNIWACLCKSSHYPSHIISHIGLVMLICWIAEIISQVLETQRKYLRAQLIIFNLKCPPAWLHQIFQETDLNSGLTIKWEKTQNYKTTSFQWRQWMGELV